MSMISKVLGGDVAAIKAIVKECRSFARVNQKYFVDPKEADIAVQKLQYNKDLYVFELRPGPTVLSQAFLRAGYSNVFALETNPFFSDILHELEKMHPNQFHPRLVKCPSKIAWDLLNFGEFCIHSNQEIKRVDWNSDKLFARVACFVPTAKDPAFRLHKWIEHVLLRSGIFSWGRCELVLFGTKKQTENAFGISGSKFQLMNLLFDIEAVHTIPPSAFLPKVKRISPAINVVSLVPKKDAGLLVPHDDMLNFLQFMKLLYARPSRALSFHFKILVQDRDSFLKKVGLDKDLRPRDLSKEQLLLLINEYFKWEERNDFLLNNSI